MFAYLHRANTSHMKKETFKGQQKFCLAAYFGTNRLLAGSLNFWRNTQRMAKEEHPFSQSAASGCNSV